MTSYATKRTAAPPLVARYLDGLHARVAAARHALDYSQRGLAKALVERGYRTTDRQVMRYEAGEQQIPAAYVMALHALGRGKLAAKPARWILLGDED